MTSEFIAYLERYRMAHQTLGCRITHMIGVPMIVAAIWMWSLPLFILGLALQIFGHWKFEKNKPMLLEDFHIYTMLAAIVYVTADWLEVLDLRNWR